MLSKIVLSLMIVSCSCFELYSWDALSYIAGGSSLERASFERRQALADGSEYRAKCARERWEKMQLELFVVQQQAAHDAAQHRGFRGFVKRLKDKIVRKR